MTTDNRSDDSFQAGGREATLPDGTFYRHWPVTAEQSPAEAVILLVHGLGEHSGRYQAFASYFNELGIAVVAPDHRGHGRSRGDRGHVESFDEFMAPLLELREKIREWYPRSPCFIVGHSLGGLISTRFLLEHQNSFDGAALSAAALQVPKPPSKLSLLVLRLLARIKPSLGLLQLDADEISRRPEVVRDYANDPLVHHGKVSASLVCQMFKTMAEVGEGSGGITLPMLIMHGEEDVMTAAAGSVALHANIGSVHKTLVLFPGLYHEIFNEPERLEVLAELRDWMRARSQPGHL